MAGAGLCSKPTPPTSKLQPTTRKTAWVAPSQQGARTGSTCKVIRFSPQSEEHCGARANFEITSREIMKCENLSCCGCEGCEYLQRVLCRATPVALRPLRSPQLCLMPTES